MVTFPKFDAKSPIAKNSKKLFYLLLIYTYTSNFTKGISGVLWKAHNNSKLRKNNNFLVIFRLNWAMNIWTFLEKLQKVAAKF